MPIFSSTGRIMPSLSSSSAASKCRGNSSGLPCSEASSLPRCTASCAFTVSFSQRIAIRTPFANLVILQLSNLVIESLKHAPADVGFQIAQLPDYPITKLNGRRHSRRLPSDLSSCARLAGRGVRAYVVVQNYAAWPALFGCLPSSVFSPPTLTLICLGLASAFLANFIFSTPFS